MKRVKQCIVVATAVLLAWLAGWWIGGLVQLCCSPEACRHADPAQPPTAPRAQTPVARRRTPHPTGVTTRNHSTSPAPDAPLWEERAARIINLSLGGEESAAMLETLIRNAHARGVVFVGAAGNERTGRPVYPAAYPEVLSVTALDDDGMPMPEANEGPFVDVAAPGVVSFVHGPAWYIAIGTSISSGYVSGAIAGLADRLDQSVPDAEAAVRMLFADEAETP